MASSAPASVSVDAVWRTASKSNNDLSRLMVILRDGVEMVINFFQVHIRSEVWMRILEFFEVCSSIVRFVFNILLMWTIWLVVRHCYYSFLRTTGCFRNPNF